MTSLNEFYTQIDKAVKDASNSIGNLGNDANLYDTLEAFELTISDNYTGEGNKESIWDKFKGLSDRTTTIDVNSIIYKFKEWSNTAGKDNGMLTWEDISGGEDEIWTITDKNSVNGDNTSPPVGNIYMSQNLTTAEQVNDIDISKVDKYQINKMLYELIYQEKKLDNNSLIRSDNIRDISNQYIEFKPIPEAIKANPQILNIKKEIIRLYAIVKSRFNESNFDTGLTLD